MSKETPWQGSLLDFLIAKKCDFSIINISVYFTDHIMEDKNGKR